MSPPKKPAKKPTRAQRLAAARRKRERRGLVLRLAAGGIALSLLAVLAYSAIGGGGPGDDDILTANGCTFDTRHDGTASQQSDHIGNPTYAVDPPAGGAHTPSAASPGFYRAGQPVPRDGQLVHATEHGFVVLWYRSDLGAADAAAVEALSDRFGRELIIAPRPSLDGPVAVTAWHRRLLCPVVDSAAIAHFTTEFRDQGPEKGYL